MTGKFDPADTERGRHELEAEAEDDEPMRLNDDGPDFDGDDGLTTDNWVERARAVEQGESTEGLVIALTGPNSVTSPGGGPVTSTAHRIRFSEKVEIDVSMTIAFDEPLIGPYGFNGEPAAVDTARIATSGGRVVRVEGRGRNVRKSGEVGTKQIHAYSFSWRDVPEDVKRTVRDKYAEAVAAAPASLNEDAWA